MTYGAFPYMRATYSYDRSLKSNSSNSKQRIRETAPRRQRPPQKQPIIREILADRPRPEIITTTDNDRSGDNVSLLEPTVNNEASTAFPYAEEPEIKEDENAIEINLDLPGVKGEDLKVELDETIMLINGMRRNSKGKWKAFARSFQVDVFSIDIESIKANLLDGVLTITMQKKDTGGAMNIEVTAYEEGEEEAILKAKKEEEEKAEKKKKITQRLARKKRMSRLGKAGRSRSKEKLLQQVMPDHDDNLSLLIEIKSCANLLRGDRIGNKGKGKSDPYVRAVLGDDVLHQTKYVAQTLNPVFRPRHDNVFVWNGLADDLMENGGITFFVMDYDMGIADDPLGEVLVGVEDLVTMNGDTAEFDISPPSHRRNVDAGTIQMKVSYATEADRKKYHQPARRRTTFWKPSSQTALNRYKTLYQDDDGASSTARSVTSRSVSSWKSGSRTGGSRAGGSRAGGSRASRSRTGGSRAGGARGGGSRTSVKSYQSRKSSKSPKPLRPVSTIYEQDDKHPSAKSSKPRKASKSPASFTQVSTIYEQDDFC